MDDDRFTPQRPPAVMVSSTFADLKRHRAALVRAIEAEGLHAVAMEQDEARPDGTVIDSSLQMVRGASAYVGVISHKYGHIPDSAESNPDGFSLTELEFREARRLGRHILIFVMGEDHDIKVARAERDPEKVRKLEAFREEAKRAAEDSRVQRVYKEFNSFHEFEVSATRSVAKLRRVLDKERRAALAGHTEETGSIPEPPALYAEPRYIGSHEFVGRVAELQALSSWASDADQHPLLFFEAIGGAGKSMLTWEWTVNHASLARTDWAGRFWYSFYEKGAVMADFVRRALSYMTGKPVDVLLQRKRSELTKQLLSQLQDRPWLLVLDGLERVMVAYHRYDAAQMADEKAGRPGKMGDRDPAAAIRPEDDDLLRLLTAVAPSKILITSRLAPYTLLNHADRPVPGVRREYLSGLRPADAEALLRACGVRGDSRLIQDYLERHCGCHPLVTGVIAGLVHEYLPARDDFDAWAADPAHGGPLDFDKLNLDQKRNHILRAAVDALSDEGRQLLSTLALLSEAADYDVLAALNPHLPARSGWPAEMRDDRFWRDSPDHDVATSELSRTVRDLERRGLLQYDRQDRYDLHPVVRGYMSGRIRGADPDRIGQRVVDYFSQQARDPYAQAETLDDVQDGLQLVRTLLQLGRPQEAFDAYSGDLAQALSFNLEAKAEIVSLLRPFFTREWTTPVTGLDEESVAYLATETAAALQSLGQPEQALTLHGIALTIGLKQRSLRDVRVNLANITEVLSIQNRLAQCGAYTQLALDLAELINDNFQLFGARLRLFRHQVETGEWKKAEATWRLLDMQDRDLPRNIYRPGGAEEIYARMQFWRGRLTEKDLAQAEHRARSGRNRPLIRVLHTLRGEWRLERGEWALAAESLNEAVRMAREAGMAATRAEAWLTRAQFRLGQISDARDDAIRLSSGKGNAHRALAELWYAMGDAGRATEHALAAYRWAWADGKPADRKPCVHAYELDRVAALLKELGADIPALPDYDPAQDEPLPFAGWVRNSVRGLDAGARG